MSLSKIKVEVMTKKGNVFTVALPSKREVCPSCHGSGTELYGSLKGAAFSASDFEEDPDFAEAYFGGQYDVECSECHGRNVVDVVDRERVTTKMLERLSRYLQSKAESDAEDRYWARMEGGLLG